METLIDVGAMLAVAALVAGSIFGGAEVVVRFMGWIARSSGPRYW